MISLSVLDELRPAVLMTLYHHEHGLRLVYVLVLWLYEADSTHRYRSTSLRAVLRKGSRTSSHQANCTCLGSYKRYPHTKMFDGPH